MKKRILALSLIAGLSCSSAQAGFFKYIGRKVGFKNFALISSVGISFPYLFSNKKGVDNKIQAGNKFWQNKGSSFVRLLRTNAASTCDWIKNKIK